MSPSTASPRNSSRSFDNASGCSAQYERCASARSSSSGSRNSQPERRRPDRSRPGVRCSSGRRPVRQPLTPEPGDDVVDRVAHRAQIAEVLVVDGEPDGSLAQLLFERFDQLDERERVGVEVVGEAGVEGDAVLVDLEDLGQPFAEDPVHLVGADRAVARRGSQPASIASLQPPDDAGLDALRRDPHGVRRSRAPTTSRARSRTRRRRRGAPRRRSCRDRGRRPRRAAAGRRPCPPPSPPASSRARGRRARRRRAGAPSSVLSATLPVNPSVTMTSTRPVHEVAALDVADEARHLLEQRERALAQLVALARLLAVREQTDRGLVDRQAGARVLPAHARELGEPFRGAVDGRPAVDEELGLRAAGTGIGHRDRGTGDPADPAHAQQRRRHRRAGVAGADHRLGAPFAHGLRRHAPATSPSCVAPPRPGSSSMATTSPACSTLDARRAAAVGKQRRDRVLLPDEQHVDAELGRPRRARRATISSGALSPPIASIATGDALGRSRRASRPR